jgi:ribosomal protein S18 acetylase RimI-like enzyme
VIRPTEVADAAAVMALLKASGQFDDDGLVFIGGILDEHLNRHGPAIWLTADDGVPVGVAYCAPEAVASGTWNLLMLWTREDRQARGFGKQLLDHLEQEPRQRPARLLIVETSSLPAFAAARAFYAKRGFCHEATIRNFYAAEDDKLVFTKPVTRLPASAGASIAIAVK